MKKSAFQKWVFCLAFGLSILSFKSSPKPTTLYQFIFTGDPTNANHITAKNFSSTQYTKWACSTSSCVFSASEKACVIDVDTRYVNDDLQLNATDPDGVGSKEAFPMAQESNVIGGTTYYKVSSSIQIPNVIEVHNAHICDCTN